MDEKRIKQAEDNFKNYLNDKKSRFDKLLPELERKRKQSKVEKETNVFRGKKGINQIYAELLNSGGNEYNTFGGGKDVTYTVMGEDWWRNLHIKRIAKKIKSRQVFDTTIEDYGRELNKLPFTNIKFLPQEFAQLTETVLIGDYVGIIIFTSEPYGILIHDKEVAEGYRKHFNLVWKSAKA